MTTDSAGRERPQMDLSEAIEALVTATRFETRTDYSSPRRIVAVGWNTQLENVLDWSCTSSTCNEDGMDEDMYHGWAKWQRIEVDATTSEVLTLSIECGHCGTEYTWDADGNELD